MSVPAPEPTPTSEREAVELPATGDAAFSALMDFLAPEESDQDGAAPAAETDPAGAGTGLGAAAVEGAAGADQQPVAPEAGDGGEPSVPVVGEPAGSVDAASLSGDWAKVSEGIETSFTETYKAEALADVRQEFGNYFEAIEKHPRLLVGQKVPAIGHDGEETLRDSADAKEWQDAVKSILTREVLDRAQRKSEDARPMMETLHSSISLFRDNTDLIPGTKQFDRDLADRFATFAKPYEKRTDGKLTGYTIPVQPLVNQVRAQLAAERAAKPAAPAAPTPQQQRVAEQPRNNGGQWEAPQAGIASKAGGGGEGGGADFSALFGTLGLPDLRI